MAVTGAISFTRYVSIVSGVGAGANVSTRDLGTRIFTDNNLLPPQSYIEFTSAADVGTYFGFLSVEYLRAVFYFGWISKNITTPQKMSFARWVDTAVGSMIFGKPATYALGSLTPITSGQFTLTLGGFTHTVSGVNLSGAASLAAVAALIQTAVRSFSGGGAAWTGATVSFDATRGCFDLVSGSTGADVVGVVAGVSNDLAGPIGWLTGAIYANGSAVETITQTLTASVQASNNFGAFLFIPTLNTSQITEAATWNDLQNVLFQFLTGVTASNAAAISAAVFLLSGCAMTLAPISTEYPEMIPGMILAATDYAARNATQNYMFQIFSVTPSVTNDADANTYDALRVNYYGQTQTAGQFIQFYQRGVLTGLAVDPVDQNVYANEQWLKDAAAAAIMTLLLALAKVSANVSGRAQLLSQIQSVVNVAVVNGTISVGKTLSNAQKLFITNATGDTKAWYQVQTIGYWLDVVFETFVDSGGITEYKAVYTLIYSKDDVIRKVEGHHVLI